MWERELFRVEGNKQVIIDTNLLVRYLINDNFCFTTLQEEVIIL